MLLLATGVLLGPDVLNVVRPAALGASLHDLVGFAVAVILFEGGMNLNLERLRREARSIRQLMTVGALVTTAGAALAARWIMGWSWTLSILFGTLVMVTGPTVITPLLRRIKVKARVATVLEAEGVLVDAIGAIVAVVALEVAIGPPGGSVAFGAWHVVSRLLFGSLLGAAGGLAIAALLRFEKAIPEGLESVFTLSFILLLYQGSNAILPETGIVAAVAAGLVVGNARARVVAELRELQEQLSTLLVGLLFVLLAADVRMGEVAGLGWAGAGLVAALMFVVRPLNVLAGTWGTDLTWREKAFLGWLAPRGIVAAAVSSLFAESLEQEGIAGGSELRAMVFLVITATVLIQGLSGGLVANLLGLRRPSNRGYVILGANALGLALARALGETGEEVLLIDSNPQACAEAAAEGFLSSPRQRRRPWCPGTGRARHPRRMHRRHHQRGGQPSLRPPREEGLQGAPRLGGAPPRPSRHRRGLRAPFRRAYPLRPAAEDRSLAAPPRAGGGGGRGLALQRRETLQAGRRGRRPAPAPSRRAPRPVGPAGRRGAGVPEGGPALRGHRRAAPRRGRELALQPGMGAGGRRPGGRPERRGPAPGGSLRHHPDRQGASQSGRRGSDQPTDALLVLGLDRDLARLKQV